MLKVRKNKRLDQVLQREQNSNSKNLTGNFDEAEDTQALPFVQEKSRETLQNLKRLVQDPELQDISVDDEPHQSNNEAASEQASVGQYQLPNNFKENSTNIFDEMEQEHVIRSVGSYLYQDFKDRMQRQQVIQANLEKEMYRKMNESKVNHKSQKLVIKKIEKNIEEVLDFVDDQESRLITFNGLGYVIFFLDVFKVQYNEEYLSKLSKKAGKEFSKDMVNEQALNHYKVISFVTLKNEERRIDEETFHHKVWKLLNPYESDFIEREILFEFLKLIFDPYTPLENLVPIIKDFIEIIKSAKEMNQLANGIDLNTGEIDRAPTMKAIKGPDQSDSTTHNKVKAYTISAFKTPDSKMSKESIDNSQSSLPTLEEKIEDLLNHFKYLYDYQGGNRKIKIPSHKKQKAFYEVYKECTFKPALNKKSLGMGHKRKPLADNTKQNERTDTAGTIVKTNKQTPSSSSRKPGMYKSPSAASFAGKIVPKTLVRQLTEGGDSSKKRDKSPNEIHNRLYELHSLNQQKLDKNESIRLANIRKEEAKCTFRPKISKGSSKMTARPQTAEIRTKNNKRQKRVQSPPSVFEKLYDGSKKSP